MPKERTRRYSIEIKDATGRSVWFAAADWTDEERRIAILRIDANRRLLAASRSDGSPSATWARSKPMRPASPTRLKRVGSAAWTESLSPNGLPARVPASEYF
jgi:hypothetical protein